MQQATAATASSQPTSWVENEDTGKVRIEMDNTSIMVLTALFESNLTSLAGGCDEDKVLMQLKRGDFILVSDCTRRFILASLRLFRETHVAILLDVKPEEFAAVVLRFK